MCATTPEGCTSGLASPRKDLSQGRWADFLEEQVTEDVPEPPNAEEEGATPRGRADSLCVGEVGRQAMEAVVGCEDAPSSAEEESATLRGRQNDPCVGEGGVTSPGEDEAAPGPSNAEKVSGTAGVRENRACLGGEGAPGEERRPQQGGVVEDGG